MMSWFIPLISLFCWSHTESYRIYTVDDPHVCNQSIYLEQGANSAAILKLTTKSSYLTAPLYCTINFKAPIHNWSGLTGILEQVDLRRYEDNAHHLGQSVCVDHITVKTEKEQSIPNEKQCGTWSIAPGQPLSRLGYNKALVGSCPHADILGNEKCHVTELLVVVSIGREKESELWKNVTWAPHKGFTFVVTAYSYPIKNGESECRDGLRSCSPADSLGARLGAHHCVHDSLWCDSHVNCGLMENMDEISCTKKGIWNGLVTVVVGPWMGASMFLLLMFCGILYYRSSRERLTMEAQTTNQEINSYAESYELSSNLSSAHHMAIQVRVVCNSNHSHRGSSRGGIQPWKNDLPPSYDTLFPQGPPQPYSPVANIIATVSQGTSGTAMNAVGINVSSTMSLPSVVATTSGARCNELASTSTNIENSRSTSGITSIIDLNFRSNNLQIGNISGSTKETTSNEISTSTNNNTSISRSTSDASTIDVNFRRNNLQSKLFPKSNESNVLPDSSSSVAAANSQTSVVFTLTPNHTINNKEHCVSTQTGEVSSDSEDREITVIQSTVSTETDDITEISLCQRSPEEETLSSTDNNTIQNSSDFNSSES